MVREVIFLERPTALVQSPILGLWGEAYPAINATSKLGNKMFSMGYSIIIGTDLCPLEKSSNWRITREVIFLERATMML